MATDPKRLAALHAKLEAAGFLDEILDVSGNVIPSPSAVEKVSRENAELDGCDQFLLAKRETLVELAERHGIDMR